MSRRALWSCPRCGRRFRQVNQSHSCGVGSRTELLADRPESLVRLYGQLEKAVRSLRGTEIAAKRRCALFRTTRIFADAVIMRDCIRLALLLDRDPDDPIFFKTQRLSAARVAMVAKLRSPGDLRRVLPYLKEAHRHALED